MSELKSRFSEVQSQQKQIAKTKCCFQRSDFKRKAANLHLEFFLFCFFALPVGLTMNKQWKNVFQSWEGVTDKFEFKPLIFQNLLGTRRKHPQVLQIPFTVLKTPPPISLSRLSSCTLFTSTPVAGLLQRRREGPMHMSAQFIKIPIVFSQRAPQRGLWAARVSQHGLIYSDSTPNYFTRRLWHACDLM